MKLLVIDGNSIVNRAFYGIKLLTTKKGEYTNAVYGFLNIYLKLKEMCSPDCVAVAFDVHAPFATKCTMTIKQAGTVCPMSFGRRCRFLRSF